jgi:Flp pilus assembly protein TadG
VVRTRCGRNRRAGQALVEFALIAPILLLLVLGIVDFARAWMQYLAITDAAREGARVAVVANATTTIDTVARRINTNLYIAGVDTASATKTITGFGGGTDTPLRVEISYPFMIRWITPFMGWTGAQASVTMRSGVTFRNE